MSLRKLTHKERKETRGIAVSMLSRGGHPDDVRAELSQYLRSRDWPPLAASVRAKEVCELVQRSEPGDRSERGEP